MLYKGMNSNGLRSAINQQLGTLRSGSLCFWGNWFGKPHDGNHRIVGSDLLDDTIVIYFDGAESLTIDAPREWSLDGGKLVVRKAMRVRFQWFYYGRLPSRETLRFDEYHWTDTGVSFASDFRIGRRPELDRTLPAVELHAP